MAPRESRAVVPAVTVEQTVGEFVAWWLAHPPATLRPISVASHRKVLLREVVPALGRVPLGDLTREHVSDVADAVIRRGLSRASVRNVLDALSVILRSAADAGLVERNLAYHAVSLRPLVPQTSRPPSRQPGPLRPLDPVRVASRQYAESLRQSAFAVTLGERAPATLGAYADVWIARQAPRRKARSLECYASILKVHLLPHFGEATRLASITRPQVRDFLLGKLAEGYAGETVRHMLVVLHSLFKAARLEDSLVRDNPCDGLTTVLPPRPERDDSKVLRPDALQRLLAALETLHPRIYPMVVVAAACGLRLGELLALRWPDVDLENGAVVVSSSRDWRGHMNTPKGGKPARLPLTGPAVTALRALRAMPAVSREPWVFASAYSGKPFSRVHVWRTLHRACRMAETPLVSMHVLRHSFITAAAMTGEDTWIVQQLARHRSIQTTLGYVHLERERPEHTRAMQAVERYLFGRSKKADTKPAQKRRKEDS